MGRPKALLSTPGGRPFVAAVVHAFAAAGVSDLIVVTGRDHDLVAAAIDADRPAPVPRVVRNLDPSRGQLSSLWTGMDALSPEAEAMLVTLVDVPMVRSETIVRVADAWQRTRAPIVRPAIGTRHGHPVIFDRALFAELRAAPLDGGAKTVVRAHERDIVNVTVDDEGCLVDVDTPADYASLRGSRIADVDRGPD